MAVCLAERFARSVARWPDELALDIADQRLSYRELDAWAARLAGRILDRAGGKPNRVGLWSDRTAATYAGYLAVQRLGATVVPLNPRFPVERNRRTAAAANLDAVLAAGHTPGLFGDRPVVDPNSDQPGVVPEPASSPNDVAYLLFTSGSTGEPKGVPIGHRQVSAYLDHVISRYQLAPGARLSQNFELTFDLSVFDLFAAWGSGATVVVPTRAELMSPAAFVTRRSITHWFSVPSAISVAHGLGRLVAGTMPDLRWSLFCGEQLTLDQARVWHRSAPHTTIENLYGPTELTISCAQYRLPAREESWPTTGNGTVPIGTVHPGLESVVLDGELCVRGAQRFDGYLDPAHNHGRFLARDGETAQPGNLTGAPPPALWYRTGDLVRVEGGELVHLGRVDDQVKIQGHRVEPAEVEAALRTVPGVFDAVAVALVEPTGARALHAVYLGDKNVAAGLADAVRALVPTYMVPRSISHLDQLPRNANGKIDRAAIAEHLVEGEACSASFSSTV